MDENISDYISRYTTNKVLIVDREVCGNEKLLSDYISGHTGYDIIVVDDASPYRRIGTQAGLLETLKNVNLSTPHIIITSDFNYYNTDIPEIIYYPYHAVVGVEQNKNIQVDIKSSRQWNLSFMSFHMYHVRLIAILKLFKQSWFPTCLLNFPLPETMTAVQLQKYNYAVSQLTGDENAVLTNMLRFAPMVADKNDLQTSIIDIKNAGFTDCYISCMFESDYDTPFMTEKCLKPFFTGQFSAVLGNDKLYDHLEHLGFDTMRDYLDLSTRSLDFNERINHMIEQVDCLLPKIHRAWDDSYERRLHNYNYARSDEFINKLESKLKDKLNDGI